MKAGQGFLLVFSITSESSLRELAGLREEIIRIKDDENVPMVIVGNKADLEMREVPRAKGFSTSQRWGSPYYESSARTRSKPADIYENVVSFVWLICAANVEEVFIDLCRQMLRKDDELDALGDQDASYKYDSHRGGSKRRRRKILKDHPRCVIL